MGAVKDLLDPETGERIGSRVSAPPCLKQADKKNKKKKRDQQRTKVKWNPLASLWRIYGALWPTTWEHLLAALILSTLLMIVDDSKLNHISKYLWIFADILYLDERMPRIIRIISTSFVVGTLYFITLALTRQFLLKVLLSYMGWLYQPPKSRSKVVALWAILVKAVGGRINTARLYSYENCLPRMPVPPLKSTVTKLLDSVKPVLEKEEFLSIESEAKKFLAKTGFFPQLFLILKSWWAPNYHTDWWEKYVYLMCRSPLPIGSNYYVLDYHNFNPTKKQSARAAAMILFGRLFREKVHSHTLEPIVLRDTIPLCMEQYKRMFATARIPGKEIDEYEHNPTSQHYVIFVKGCFYKLSDIDEDGKEVNAMDLQRQLEWIMADAKERSLEVSEAASRIAALTGTERTNWHNVRNKHFSSGLNKESLKAIEESICVIVLSEEEFGNVQERCKYTMHADGSSIWYDKTFNAVIFKDGRIGLNFEHGWSDAPVPCHLAEYSQRFEANYRVYNEDGDIKPFWLPTDQRKPDSFNPSKCLITPEQLQWEMNEELEGAITSAHIFNVKNNSDLDLAVGFHDAFGKGFIKTTGNSPDAFIQMALQLAYYRDSGSRFALTYEATITRFFLHGRTETVRSLTQEVQEFVLAMNDEDVQTEEKARLMKVAAAKHQNNYRDCMSGKGIDRHLFALYVVCKAKGYDTSFLSKAFAIPWTLSTSCTPINTLEGLFHHVPEMADMVSPGGGFGPVSDSGYGIAYSLPHDNLVQFHITSKHSCEETNSQRMLDNIFTALAQMKAIFNADE